MKKLPLLSSGFELFGWDKSIGNATYEQLQNSYTALVGKGLTTEFSRIVWNDLVDLLYKALNEAGFSWDSTYGNVGDTKMMFKYDDLTSYRFNAVTQNITKLIGTTWRWEADDSKDGFIGRRQVYGVSEIGAKADFVYGWYIVELARVLNVFIAILKNEADFRELKIAERIDTNNDSILLHRPSAPLNVAYKILTRNDVDLLIRKAGYLNFQVALRTRPNAVLYPAIPFHLISRNVSGTQSKADIERIRPKWIKANGSSKSSEKASIRSGKATRLVGDYSHKTKNNAYMSFNECFDMYVINRINTNNNAHAVKIPSLNVSFNEGHYTRSVGEIYKAVAYDLAAEDSIYTDYSSLLNYAPAFNLGRADKNLYSKHKGSINPIEAYPMSLIHEYLYSSYKGSVNLPEAEYLNAKNRSISGHKADVIAALPKSMESSLRDSSYDHAELIKAEPSYIQSSDSSFASDSGELSSPGARIFSFAERLLSSHKVHLTGGKVLELIANNHSETRDRVYVVFDGIEDEWVIQTGSNLYIKQVYSSGQSNSELFIDTDMWLNPIQTGSNLYIRQLESIKGDDD